MTLTAAQLALYMEKPITSIEAEFRNIATSTVRIDELPVGVETKNRYANVLPVPETRVHIHVRDNQPADTIEQYINANYIKVRVKSDCKCLEILPGILIIGAERRATLLYCVSRTYG